MLTVVMGEILKPGNTKIKNKKSWLNPKNIRTVNIEYLKIKEHFKIASDTKKIEDWWKVYDKYKKYCNETYDKDIDALIELGEACTHLMKYTEAIECFKAAQTYQEKNPFYTIRIAENYVRNRDRGAALNEFEQLLRPNQKDDRENETLLINCGILAFKIKNKKKIEEYAKRLDAIGRTKLAKELRTNLKKEDKFIFTKGVGSRSNRVPRCGVLLMLLMWPDGATRNQVKEMLLNNSDTTKDTLEELEKAEKIERKEFDLVGSITEIYSLTPKGKKEAKQFCFVLEALKKDEDAIKQIRDFGITSKKDSKKQVLTLAILLMKYENWEKKAGQPWEEAKNKIISEVKGMPNKDFSSKDNLTGLR